MMEMALKAYVVLYHLWKPGVSEVRTLSHGESCFTMYGRKADS